MTQPPRQFTLKDRVPASVAYGSACRQQSRSDRPTNATFGPEARSHAGGTASTGGEEVLPEEGFEQEDAAREWLRHVEAGRIGAEHRD